MALTDTEKKHWVHPIKVPTTSSLRSFNFYLVEDGDSLTLIDAGVDTEECWDCLNSALSENGFTLRALTRILLTHHHDDHIGLVNRITSLQDVPVYAPSEAIHRLKREKDFMSMRVRFFDQLYEEMGCGSAGKQQVQWLKKAARKNEKFRIRADILPLEDFDKIGPFRVVETPGHSHDHVIFLDEKQEEMFVGDHVLHHISSNALVEPDRYGKRIRSLVEYIDSLERCLELNANTLYTGHGEFVDNHKALITNRLNRIEEKSAKFLNNIDHGISTASDLAQAYYRKLYESQFSLVMSEVIGHLDYLEMQHKVEKEQIDGVWHYYTA